ncbi:hypothetical protein PV772_22680 [Pseudarthrobacter sp. CC12]
MPYFLDYEAEGPVIGHVQIPRENSEEAALYAQGALRGLRCLTATVRRSETMRSTPDDCQVIAQYTRSEGWKTENSKITCE